MVTTAEAERSSTRKSRSRKAPAKATSTASRKMTQEHKDAIAEGREQARTVGKYLEALRANKPKRGRKVTEESLQRKLERIESELADADALDQLQLLQQKKDIAKQLETKAPVVDLKALEADFVKVAKSYADRKGISRSTFVDVGVDPAVLKAAGI